MFPWKKILWRPGNSSNTFKLPFCFPDLWRSWRLCTESHFCKQRNTAAQQVSAYTRTLEKDPETGQKTNLLAGSSKHRHWWISDICHRAELRVNFTLLPLRLDQPELNSYQYLQRVSSPASSRKECDFSWITLSYRKAERDWEYH